MMKLIVLTLISILVFMTTSAFAATKLIQSTDLTYLGSFRLPTTTSNGIEFAYGAEAATYNPTNNSLFISGFRGGATNNSPMVAEVSIPSLKTGTYTALNTSSFLQGFYDITEGNVRNVGAGGSQCFAGSAGQEWAYGALAVYGSSLIGTAFNYYDGSHCQALTHFKSNKTLATSGDFSGFYGLSGVDTSNAGYVVKSMSAIPSEYQTALGGKMLVGGTGMSIVGRTSWGPSAYAFDPDVLGVTSPVPNTPLLYYTTDHLMTGSGGQTTNGIWNRTTYIQGMHFIEGTKSILFVGQHGYGTYCYGDVPPCVDPTSNYKGEHSTAFREQFWLYNVDDLIAVKAGSSQPYQPQPYAIFSIASPYDGDVTWGGGASGTHAGSAYDSANQKLYIIQHSANNSGYPAVHVYSINAEAQPPDTVAPTVTAFTLPATATSLTVSVSSFTATDAVGVTGYAITQSSTPPLPGAIVAGSAPTTVTAAGSGSQTFYAWAKDAAGNVSALYTARTVAITLPPEAIAPTISTPLPTGTQSSGTTSTTISVVATDASGVSACKYGTTNVAYDSLPSSLTNIPGNIWSASVSGLSDGQSYNYFVRCADTLGNKSPTATVISFSVATSGHRVVNVSTLSQLYAAFASEQDGDEIVIAPGTYTLDSVALEVNAPNLIIRGSTGNRDDVIIRGDAMTAGALIKFVFYINTSNTGNLTIKDLSIGRVGWHALFLNGEANAGAGSTFDNIRYFDTWEQMFKVANATGITGSSNVTVKNSLFEFTSGAAGQYYTGGIDGHTVTNWHIYNNIFRDIQSPSGSVAEHAIHLWDNGPGTANNLIERNTIINCDRGIGLWLANGDIIRNNMISHDGSGVFPDTGIDIRDTPNVKAYNNSVWIAPTGYYTGIELRGNATTNAFVVNNLSNKSIANINNEAVGTFGNNVVNAQSSWFNDITIADLHLTSAIPSVVAQGQAVGGLTDDFDSSARSGSIDIGADQITPPTGVTPRHRLSGSVCRGCQ